MISGGDAVGRKIFSTTIDEDILQGFRVTCVIQKKNMNDVLEEFMKEYTQSKEFLKEENADKEQPE